MYPKKKGWGSSLIFEACVFRSVVFEEKMAVSIQSISAKKEIQIKKDLLLNLGGNRICI